LKQDFLFTTTMAAGLHTLTCNIKETT